MFRWPKKLLFTIWVIVIVGFFIVGGAMFYLFQTADLTTPEPIEKHVYDTMEKAPFFITTMTHMEGSFDDDVNEEVFLSHIEQLTTGMDLADEYEALLTIESELPFALANIKWGQNFMQEIVDRGHGVGTHCDVGGKATGKNAVSSVKELADAMARRKGAVDALVGEAENLGCSGAGAIEDYINAAELAGFSYINGIVGLHYLPMDESNRPNGWTDDYVYDTAYHDFAPQELDKRYYPIWMSDAKDFEEDPDGTVLLSPGSMGRPACLSEGMPRPNCLFDENDIKIITDTIKDIDSWRDTTRVTKLVLYIPASDFTVENEQAFRTLYSEINKLVDQGIIEWATQKQVYDAMTK